MGFVKTININFTDNKPAFPITKYLWSYLKLLLICLLELGFGFDQSLPRGQPVGKSPYYRSFDRSANWRVKDSMLFKWKPVCCFFHWYCAVYDVGILVKPCKNGMFCFNPRNIRLILSNKDCLLVPGDVRDDISIMCPRFRPTMVNWGFVGRSDPPIFNIRLL